MTLNQTALPKMNPTSRSHCALYAELVLGGGAYQTKARLVEELSRENRICDDTTREVLLSENLLLTLRHTYLKLVLRTPIDLGLPEGGFMRDISFAAISAGLELLPTDTAPFMMKQMRSVAWSDHHAIIVASEPVVYYQIPYLFQVNSSCLRAISGQPNNHQQRNQPILYRLP